MVAPTLTLFAFTTPSTIIVQASFAGEMCAVPLSGVTSEKDSLVKKSNRAWAFIAIRGAKVRSSPQSSMDYLSVLLDWSSL